MVDREWSLNENLILRIGLFVAASYTLYIGVVQWGAGSDILRPVIVVLQLLTYVAAFLMLFSAATGVGLQYTRHLIPVLFAFALLIQSYLRIDGQPLTYGTDAAAYTQYSADLYLKGENPYGVDLSPSLPQYRMPPTLRTSRNDGGYEVVLPYPAFSFLVYIPFIVAGITDVRLILVTFHLLLLLLLYVAAPPRIRPLVLIPFFISPDIIAYTLGTVTDMTWVFFVTAAALLWNRKDASALLFGIAASTKQHPWVLAPFLLIRLWQEADGLPTISRINLIARYFGIAEIVFLVINGPFLFTSPQAWIEGVLMPPLGPLIMDGEGLSTLSQIGLVYAPRSFYTLAALLVIALLAILYWLYFRRVRHVLWLLPAVILWFPYRSLQSYFVYWIPPLMASLFPSFSGPKPGLVREPDQIKPPHSRDGKRRNAIAVTMASAVACFLLGGILYYSYAGKPDLQINVQRALVDPQTNQIRQLEITVFNGSGKDINPVFWVKQTGRPRFHWNLVRGPITLTNGMHSSYVIQAAFDDFEIPNGTDFSVAANDAQNADTTSFSSARPVNLVTHASLLNPEFFYWTQATPTKVEQPYAWGFYQLGNDSTKSASIQDSSIAGRQCVKLAVTQSASRDASHWVGGYLDQWIEFPDYKFRVPVYPTFQYVGQNSPQTVLGVEVRDDLHQLWYMFSDEPERTWHDSQNPNLAYHIMTAPLNQWSDQTLDIAREYAMLGWELPAQKNIVQDGQNVSKRMINFRLFVGTNTLPAGTFSGCFGSIIQHLP